MPAYVAYANFNVAPVLNLAHSNFIRDESQHQK